MYATPALQRFTLSPMMFYPCCDEEFIAKYSHIMTYNTYKVDRGS